MSKSRTRQSGYNAKYLLLLNGERAQRALLFGGDHRYLAEVIGDDGVMVENLVRAGKRCSPPEGLVIDPAWVRHAASEEMECFALG